MTLAHSLRKSNSALPSVSEVTASSLPPASVPEAALAVTEFSNLLSTPIAAGDATAGLVSPARLKAGLVVAAHSLTAFAYRRVTTRPTITTPRKTPAPINSGRTNALIYTPSNPFLAGNLGRAVSSVTPIENLNNAATGHTC